MEPTLQQESSDQGVVTMGLWVDLGAFQTIYLDIQAGLVSGPGLQTPLYHELPAKRPARLAAWTGLEACQLAMRRRYCPMATSPPQCHPALTSTSHQSRWGAHSKPVTPVTPCHHGSATAIVYRLLANPPCVRVPPLFWNRRTCVSHQQATCG